MLRRWGLMSDLLADDLAAQVGAADTRALPHAQTHTRTRPCAEVSFSRGGPTATLCCRSGAARGWPRWRRCWRRRWSARAPTRLPRPRAAATRARCGGRAGGTPPCASAAACIRTAGESTFEGASYACSCASGLRVRPRGRAPVKVAGKARPPSGSAALRAAAELLLPRLPGLLARHATEPGVVRGRGARAGGEVRGGQRRGGWLAAKVEGPGGQGG